MGPTNPPLEIAGYQLDEFHIQPLASIPAAEIPPVAKRADLAVGVDFDFFTHSDDRQQYAASLKIQYWIRTDEEASADEMFGEYRVRIHVVGFFRLGEPLAESGEIPDRLAVNGLTILYGIIRGMASSTSGWLNVPQIVLPTVYFGSIVATKREAKLSHTADSPDEDGGMSRREDKHIPSTP